VSNQRELPTVLLPRVSRENNERGRNEEPLGQTARERSPPRLGRMGQNARERTTLADIFEEKTAFVRMEPN
jgi:hypothetical protein